MKKNLTNFITDPGVLFSIFHTITFAATGGLSSLPFALGAASLAISSAFKVRKMIAGNVPATAQTETGKPSALKKLFEPASKFINSPGAAMFVNGTIMSGVAVLSLATGLWAPALIGACFSIANASKGLEMNGSPYSLKAQIHQRFPDSPENGKLKNAFNFVMRNTIGSAEFIASAGAFTVGFIGAGAWAGVGLGFSAAGLTLSAFANQKPGEDPRWHQIVKQTPLKHFEKALESTQFLRDIRSLNLHISDAAVTRGGMAAASLMYGVSSALSTNPNGKWLALGQVFAVAANSVLTWWQIKNENKAVFAAAAAATAVTPSAPQNLSGDQPVHTPRPGLGS